MNAIDPLGLVRFEVFGYTVDLQVSGSFLPINIAYNFGELSLSNFSFNAIFPPLTAGIGVDISINPPDPCAKYVSPYVGFGKNLSIGTNVILVSEDPLELKVQGLNISLGYSKGFPFGVLIPNAFSRKK